MANTFTGKRSREREREGERAGVALGLAFESYENVDLLDLYIKDKASKHIINK